MAEYTDVLIKVKPGVKGVAQIVHDTPDRLTRLLARMHGMPLNRGRYARLLVNGQVMMTDAEFERRTNRSVISKARGDVLIAGLGIGLILDPIIAKAHSVTVVEKYQDVIDLVAPAFPAIRVIRADVLRWKPPTDVRYDAIYFDIWPDICINDHVVATKLERRFKPHLRRGGYMGSWCEIASTCV